MTKEQIEGSLPEGSLPEGKYTFVGVDIDSTGRRILDEIVHLAAYSPTSEYSQYIMPLMNLNPAARQRHQLRVINVGFFRMLKCMQTDKVVKSKTEIAALRSFLDWLEARKAADAESKGIVLIYHETIKFLPFMLLQAFQRYDLLERFKNVVVGMVDGFALCEKKCGNAVKTNSLRQLAKLFLNYEDDKKNFDGNAKIRAKLAYQVVQHLAKGEREDLKSDSDITTEVVQGFVHSVNFDIDELSNQNKCIDLQHTFRPIFVQYFKTNLFHRYKAVTFRRVLAEKGFDLKTLESIWNEKKREGLVEVVSSLDNIKDENRSELVDILDSYFDPEKEEVTPVVAKKPERERRRSFKKNKEKRDSRSLTNNNNEGESHSDQPPSTPESTSQSPRKQRRPRRFSAKHRPSKNLDTNKKEDETEVVNGGMVQLITPEPVAAC